MLGAGFKPVVRYYVSRVGSTPTGFRQLVLGISNPCTKIQFGCGRIEGSPEALNERRAVFFRGLDAGVSERSWTV